VPAAKRFIVIPREKQLNETTEAQIKMPNELPIPPELQHLIEKRQGDRRSRKPRRVVPDRRRGDLGLLGSLETIDDVDALPLEERRASENRRKTQRRKTQRRKTDC
jgi:hypothetical protein